MVMGLLQGGEHVMADAAVRIEAKHQLIHNLQLRLQKQLPDLAARWETREFNAFQRHYCLFDSEIERVKQSLDMVHASLTGQTVAPVPPLCGRTATAPSPPRSGPAPEGAQRLAAANAELNALLGALRGELMGSMSQWDDASRAAWNAAQTSWAESNLRQRALMSGLPQPSTPRTP